MRLSKSLLTVGFAFLILGAISGCAKRSPTEAMDAGEGTCESCHVQAGATSTAIPVDAKYLVSKAFVETVHGRRGCNGCHGGEAVPQTEERAHENIVADPSGRGQSICVGCHKDVVDKHEVSPHGSQSGFLRAIATRMGVSEVTGSAREMFEKSCGNCHASCGKCHIARPKPAGGGLVAQHAFQEEPDPMANCLGCHGERIGAEFTGQIPGNEPDVHFEHGMTCFDCHPKGGFHGDGTSYARRYDVADLPKCVDCHSDVLSETTENLYHKLMASKVQCQVCHAQPYTTCYNCHVGKSEYQLTSPKETDFRIGKNPRKDDRHPWEWVVLRHVPIAPDSYSEWGVSLPQYSSYPTWVYASPHNIRKNTPQNSGCYGPCHQNPDLFLTDAYLQQKVDEGLMTTQEVQANATVVVEEVP